MAPGNPQNKTVASFRESLAPAVKKALVQFWGSEKILDEPNTLADLGPDALVRVKRIGRISLVNIARALELFGYVESSKRWLAARIKTKDNDEP